MGILKDEIIGIIVDKGNTRISAKFQELLSKNKYNNFCEEIPQIIETKVLFPVEDKSYFNDLQIFYQTRKVVAAFVISLLSSYDNSVQYLTNKFAEDFVTEYPQHKLHLHRIKDLLTVSAETIKAEIKSRELITDDQEIQFFIAQKSKELSEGQAHIEIAINRIEHKVDNLTNFEKKFVEMQKDSEKNVSSILSIGELADDTEFAVKVKDIEKNIQQKLKFPQAITQYNELINDIKETIDNPNELLTYIYINLALCYANVNDFKRADKSMVYAQKYCNWEKSAKFNYVKGYICWKQDRYNIKNAIEFLDIAISLDQGYFQARLLRCQLGAYIGESREKIEAMVSEMEHGFNEHTQKVEIYKAKGLIYKAYGDYNLAEEWMLKAEKEEHSIECLINLAILYYGKATENNEHGKRLLKFKIDYPEIFKSYECFKRVMKEMTQNERNLYGKEFIEIYISVCMLCEHPEQIENMKITDKEMGTLDYETQKNIIYHETIRGKAVCIDQLSKEDKLFLSCIEKADSGKIEEAFELVKTNIDGGETCDVERKYNLALQLAIELKRLDEFRQLRDDLIRNKIDCPYLDLYDAEYSELVGDYERSKRFYDSHIEEAEGSYLLNAVRFYRKHSYESELKYAYVLILKKIGTKQIALHNQEKIIIDAFNYMIEHDINLAVETLLYFDENTLKEESFQKISEVIYLRVMNVSQLISIYESNKSSNISFEQKINYIILLKYNLQFDKAREEAEKLLSVYTKESRDCQIRFLEIFSEICLFVGDMKKSIEYIAAAKDLAQELVYNPIHQIYMLRLIRCGNEDGISYGIQFKQTHPNVANWLKQFQVLEKNEEGEERLTDEFAEIIEKQKKRYETALSFYKDECISFYQLQKLLDSDLLVMLNIPDSDNIHLVIGMGNIEKIDEERKRVGNKIVIDAMTILFIRYYDVVEVLNSFSVIYVTYSSIEELEKVFLQWGIALIEDTISWIRNDLRIKLYPNYGDKREEKSFYHPDYFMDSLEVAKREKCQFFCIDARAPLYFADDTDYFICIMSLVHKEEGEKSSALVSKLLSHNVTFVNFRATDIIYSLVNRMDERIVSKFFSIKSSCDLDSFLNVYQIAITDILSSLGLKEEMDAFLLHICKQIDRTFSRARRYKRKAEEYQDTDFLSKYTYYAQYNIKLLFMLYEVLSEEDGLLDKISKYTYKYFDTQILKLINETLGKNGKDNKFELVKGLLRTYY